MGKLLGIIGGMGPLASAEFVNTFYELNTGGLEQNSPACVLLSDPTFPDRTKAIEGDDCCELIDRLADALQKLIDVGATKTVICCITIHYVLPRLPARLVDRVISLIDLLVDDISSKQERHLLLCTCGTRKARIFEQDDRWHLIAPYVVFPDESDQCKIHDILYQAKQNRVEESVGPLFDSLRRKYRADRLIAGCTEVHLLAKRLHGGGWNGHSSRFADPLLALAKNLDRYLDA